VGHPGVGCQPVSSSRVSAGGRLAVRCQLRGQYGANGQKQERGGGNIASMLATTNKWAMARALGTRTRAGRDLDVSNRDFPHQRYKSSKPRPTSTGSPTPYR